MQTSLKWLLLALIGALSLTLKSKAQPASPPTQSVNLENQWDTERVLENPHKGWYHHYYDNGESKYLDYDSDLGQFPGMDHVYLRLAWSYLEKAEDQYDWSIIDDAIEKWVPQGYQIAFRITTKETRGVGSAVNQEVNGVNYATPKWVRDAGAQGTVVDNDGLQHWEPVWDDPVFLAKWNDFHAAFADRYDGQPYVSYVDLGGIGDWGEGHTGFSSNIPPTVDQVKAHIDIFKAHYVNSELVLVDDYITWGKSKSDQAILYQYALENELTFRDDSPLVDYWLHDGARDNLGISNPEYYEAVYADHPTVLETQHYYAVKGEGDWIGKNGAEVIPDLGISGADVLRANIKSMHATYIGYHGHSNQWLNDNPDLAKELANLAGYWYFIRNMGWDMGKQAGQDWYFWAEWINQGVAPAYHPYQLNVRLQGPVTKTFTIADARNQDWMDGQNSWETYSVKLPSDMPRGDYQVKLKLYDPQTQREVDLGFKTSIKDQEGYFSVGNVTLGSNSLATGTYQIIARHSGKALDVQEKSTAPGANVQQWDYHATPNQHWQVRAVGNGYYTLKAKHSGLALSVDLNPATNGGYQDATANGVNLFQYGTDNADHRLWKIEPVGQGYYKLTNKYSGQVLDVSDVSQANGANVLQWQDKGSPNQHWQLQPIRTAVATSQGEVKAIVPPEAMLRAYPNPATEQLTVEASGSSAYQATLYDLSGRQVMQHQKLRGQQQLDIRHLQPGMYILNLNDGQPHQVRQRIVVE